MADIRLLEPIITWPKNLIFGGVRGLFEGLTYGAPWGLKIGAALGLMAGMGAFTGIVGLPAIMAVSEGSAIAGLVFGGIAGTGAGMGVGAVLGAVGGAYHGLTNSGADHHTVENRRFSRKESRSRTRQDHVSAAVAHGDPTRDEQMRHYLDDLYDRDPDFVAGLESEREAEMEHITAR